MKVVQPDILLEDNHCLAIDKPAGILTMSDATGDPTAADIAKDYLRVRGNKSGNVFLGIVHRLDRPVSGVLLFARTGKAASRLADQFRRGTVRKTYLAVVEGRVRAVQGTLEDWLSKDRSKNHVTVTEPKTEGSRLSRLRYQVVSSQRKCSLLEIDLVTGRSHQIRVQLAHFGHPIVGDLRYGSSTRLGHRIALHATQLVVTHPTRRDSVIIHSKVPADVLKLLDAGHS